MSAATGSPETTLEPPRVQEHDEELQTADPSPSIFRWIAQPLICVIGVGLIFLYTNNKELSTKEALLHNSDLLHGTWRHFYLTIIAAVIVLVIAIPLGVLLTRGVMHRYSHIILAFAGFGQAAPAVGLVVLGALLFGIGAVPFIGALVVYGILPVVANVVAGLEAVDRRIIEAGRGMGMSGLAVLSRVELPISIPVMLAGVRTAVVLMCGTAAFGGFVGAGGLGTYLTTGIKLGEKPLLIIGALMIAILALFLDWLARCAEVLLTPKGLS